uniref:Putative ovule protein n=1 Tax=Solanum chacoense TaxID=4108 RepID=A0A0V0HBZ4_SOLCH
MLEYNGLLVQMLSIFYLFAISRELPGFFFSWGGVSYPKHGNQTRQQNFILGLFIVIPHTKRPLS